MLKLLPILLQLYDTPMQVEAACGAKVAGCAMKYENVCHIHVLRPQIGYAKDFEVVGHELWHCAFGDFHTPPAENIMGAD